VGGWADVTAAVHAEGGKIFCQLWHVGRISHPDLQPGGQPPVAPSAIAPAGETFTHEGMKPFVIPRALETDELPGIVNAYRVAAKNAVSAGFDGVEVHAANGYLLDEFLRDGSNTRSDAYGGGVDNRARLLLEVAEAVCGVWGASRVGVRLSPIQPFNDMRDSAPRATFTRMVELLNPFGLAYLHVTELGRDAPGAAGPVLRSAGTAQGLERRVHDQCRLRQGPRQCRPGEGQGRSGGLRRPVHRQPGPAGTLSP
jgi:N-ethylmaleimide reductase